LKIPCLHADKYKVDAYPSLSKIEREIAANVSFPKVKASLINTNVDIGLKKNKECSSF
jgi:hypothetical protein